MKKQKPNNRLAFEKATVVELNDAQLQEINGGTLWTFFLAVVAPMLGVAGQIAIAWTSGKR